MHRRKDAGDWMRTVLALLLAFTVSNAGWAADPLRIGLLHTLSPAPLYLAMQRGYFRDAGLDAQFRYFEAAQPIAAAAVSGDIDVGITALTGGFFSLAGRGTLDVANLDDLGWTVPVSLGGPHGRYGTRHVQRP